jgi:hypothetical protein
MGSEDSPRRCAGLVESVDAYQIDFMSNGRITGYQSKCRSCQVRSGRIGKPEVMAQIGPSGDYFRLRRHTGTTPRKALAFACQLDLSCQILFLFTVARHDLAVIRKTC